MAQMEGTQDPTFAANGQTTDIAGADHANAVAVQPNGRVVVAGSATGTNLDTAAVRYTLGGALDSTFDGDGKQVVPVGPGDDQANGVAVGPDGKIVVAGYVAGAANDTSVVRLNPNGSPDTTFDGDGIVVTDALTNLDDVANAVAVQPDGKVVLVGTAGNGNDADFEVLRYRRNGTLDPTFATAGKLILDIGDSTDRANAVAIQPDGKIVVVGSSFNLDPSIFADQRAVVRLLPAGTPDPNFGTAGIRRDGVGELNGVAIREDGAIIAVGRGTFTSPDPDENFLLAATYPADGSSAKADAPFGSSGLVASGMSLQPDGRILVSTVGAGSVSVGRITRAGAVDASFNGNGLAGTNAAGGSGVALAPQGKIVVAGTASADFAVARFIGDTTPPWGARMIGVPRYSLATTRTVSWTASDIGTGVAAYDVMRRGASFDGSAFTAWSAFRTKTGNVFGTFTGSPGKTYCLHVRGRDFAGNVGAFGKTSCEAIPLDERSMTAHGSWTKLANSSYYRGTAMSSTTAGSKLTIHATYRHLAVVVTTCPTCGTLKVFRGTSLLKAVDLGSSSAHRKVIQVDAPLVTRSGTIALQQSSAGKKVIVEGLAVSRT